MDNATGGVRENFAQQFFLYLVKFVALGFLAFGVGAILFQLIDKNLPDPLQLGVRNGEAFQGMLKFAIAEILIAAPIFLSLSGLLSKWLIGGEISLDSKVRRWLTYIVLTIVSITAVGDLVALVTSYLSGDLILNSFLKLLVILAICAAIFGYYLWEIRLQTSGEAMQKINKKAFWILLGAVLVFLAIAFASIDSPSVAREKRADQQVVSAIQNLQSQIESYYSDKKALPTDLADFQNRKSKYFTELFSALGGSITYLPKGEKQYELCGTFKRSNVGQLSGDFEIRWEHEAGKSCYDLEIAIDKDGNVLRGGIPGEAVLVK